MRSISLYTYLIIFLLIIAICNAGHAESKVIGVSLLTRDHKFYRDLETGLRNEAARKGYRLIVNAGEFDIEKQINQINDFITRKVDAIILAPCNSRAIGGAIAMINRSGIPLFPVDIASSSSQGKVVSHIASDNKEGGRRAAQMIAQALNGRGKVTIISHPEITSVFDRVVGFREAMVKYPKIKIIADVPAWGQRDRAMAIMEEILLKVPDVDAVFGINDDSALGALKACESAGKKIVIVGYDATPEARKAIFDGRLYGDVVQYPKKMGTIAMQTIHNYFKGNDISSEVLVQVGVYTKGNGNTLTKK
jgi:ribose transport system substrate-binding protein